MYKSIFISCLFTFILSNELTAQFGLGVFIGVNHSNVVIDNNNEGPLGDPLNGIFIGISPSYQINKKFKFSTDIQFSEKGLENSEFNIEEDVKLSYIDFIPEIEYNILSSVTVGVGVYYGILMNEQHRINDGEWSDPKYFTLFRSKDYGLSGKLKFEFKNILLFGRYMHGFDNITDLKFRDFQGNLIDTKWSNRSIQIGLGYHFGFHKSS